MTGSKYEKVENPEHDPYTFQSKQAFHERTLGCFLTEKLQGKPQRLTDIQISGVIAKEKGCHAMPQADAAVSCTCLSSMRLSPSEFTTSNLPLPLKAS